MKHSLLLPVLLITQPAGRVFAKQILRLKIYKWDKSLHEKRKPSFSIWCMMHVEPARALSWRSKCVLRIWAGGGLLGDAQNPACPWISLLWDVFVVQRECKH